MHELNETEKIRKFALICYCFLSSSSLGEYLKKIKQYLWAEEHPAVKNEGSKRI